MARAESDESKGGRSQRLNHRRAQILEKAAQLFRVKGYEATSMSDIADEVGITKAGLYYFVESKGVGPGVLSLRVTATDGQSIEETLAGGVQDDTTVPGTKQFN